MLATNQGLVCHTPAKLNLYFELLARREDGYHDVETLMAPVSLYDTLMFSPKPSGLIDLSIRFSSRIGRWSQQTINTGPENLVVQALTLLKQESESDLGGKVVLEKRIPAGAGLGGGSSDAAAALRLANHGWGLGWSTQQLRELAASLGSDVPFFLGSGPKIGRGRGDQLTPLESCARISAVIVVPPEGLSTADVYRASKVPYSPRHIEPAIAAFQTGSLRQLKRTLHNGLTVAARAISPWIDRVSNAMDRVGFSSHQMTGSGSGYFGLCRHRKEANRLASRLRSMHLGDVFAVNMVG